MAKEEHEFTGTLLPPSPWMLLAARAGWKQAELRSVHPSPASVAASAPGAVMDRYTLWGRQVVGVSW